MTENIDPRIVEKNTIVTNSVYELYLNSVNANLSDVDQPKYFNQISEYYAILRAVSEVELDEECKKAFEPTNPQQNSLYSTCLLAIVKLYDE